MSTLTGQLIQAGAPIPGNTRVATHVVVTDTAGAQAAIVLTGRETPPWSFTATVTGDGSVLATDMDAAGAVIGTPVMQAYTVVVVVPQLATSGITLTVT